MPYKISRAVKLQSFQFRVLNRVLPCNEYLCQIRIKNSANCSFCGEEDNIFHFLYECIETITFWSNLASWLEQFSDHVRFPDETMEYDFLFGLQGHSPEIKRINYILLLGEIFCVQTKTFYDNDLDIYQFLCEFKNIPTVERMDSLIES